MDQKLSGDRKPAKPVAAGRHQKTVATASRRSRSPRVATKRPEAIASTAKPVRRGSPPKDRAPGPVELVCVRCSRPRNRTRRRRDLALRRPAGRATRRRNRRCAGGSVAPRCAHPDRRRPANLAAQHLDAARQRTPDGASTQNLSLDGQGRVEDHWVQTELGGVTYLDTEPWRGEPLLDYLRKMVFWSEVTPAPADLAVLSLLGPQLG